jgi:hypothetical protein
VTAVVIGWKRLSITFRHKKQNTPAKESAKWVTENQAG